LVDQFGVGISKCVVLMHIGNLSNRVFYQI
jgi:hypothetical protein